MADPSRWLYIVGATVAVATVAAFWGIEQATGQSGLLEIGVVVAVGEIVVLVAMQSVLGQAYCESCGIGNLATSKRCWKCGAPLQEPGSPED